jgi:RNA polymerase sigma-70 factor (sigma-E family)
MTTAGNDAASTHAHEHVATVYQQVIAVKAAQYATAYDAAAGLARFRDWLQGHATADLDVAADHALARLYSIHYRPLVRLATLLVRDAVTAEGVVQDAFAGMHAGWRRLGDPEMALAYLRQAVVNRSRSVLRHRAVAGGHQQQPLPDTLAAGPEAPGLLEQPGARAVLRGLPERQREAIVLRYDADLSEDETAAAMRISRGAVRSHTSRGLAAIRAALEQASPQPVRPHDNDDAGPGHG